MAPYVGAPEIKARRLVLAVEYHGQIGNPGKYKGVTGNAIDEQILLFGLYEKDRLFFMRDYLENAKIEDPVVIDVGANTGNHALFLSRVAARVHAFEPYPPVIRRFRDNLALNPEIQNIELHEVGLGEKEAELPFVPPRDDNAATGSFRTEGRTNAASSSFARLKVVVGDEWLQGEEVGSVALVKIDVEGFEEAVLRGLRQLLTLHRPVVVVEVAVLPVGTIDSLQMLDSLFPENYEFLTFDHTLDGALSGRYHLQPLTQRVFNADSRQQLDLVAYPRERATVLPY